jgi:hypothetical protein
MPYVYIDGRKTFIKEEEGERQPPKPFRKNQKFDFKPGNQGRPAVDALERWREKYVVRRRSGCFAWKMKLNKIGRGTFFDGRVSRDAQQYAWFLQYGEYPEKQVVSICSTPCCVNPDHLREKEPPKSRRKQSAFSKEDVQSIRRRFDAGEMVIVIAKDYPTSEKAVYMAANRKSYTWVPEE